MGTLGSKDVASKNLDEGEKINPDQKYSKYNSFLDCIQSTVQIELILKQVLYYSLFTRSTRHSTCCI